MSLLRLNKILSAKGITGKELAEKTNVSQNTISNIVNGYNFPKPELLKSIADVLNVDIRELFHQTKLSEFDQMKHEQLVKIVNVIYGRDQFNVREDNISVSQLLDTNEINNAIVLMLDVLNVRAGSAGEYNLYRLLDVYLTDADSRKKINTVVDNAKLV